MFLCDSPAQNFALRQLLSFYGITLEQCEERLELIGSYWGESEAGIATIDGHWVLFLRADTPLHSALHEAAHIVCMSPERRATLFRDAGGDHAEENAVCYLQILWADLLPGCNRQRLMLDMDAWGYSFRLGTAARWFEEDAEDARLWLLKREMISASGQPTGRLNTFGEADRLNQRAA